METQQFKIFGMKHNLISEVSLQHFYPTSGNKKPLKQSNLTLHLNELQKEQSPKSLERRK